MKYLVTVYNGFGNTEHIVEAKEDEIVDNILSGFIDFEEIDETDLKDIKITDDEQKMVIGSECRRNTNYD